MLTVEARMTESDWAPMDALLLRSVDNGKTWSKPIVLCDGVNNNTTANNPTLLATKEDGVYLFYCEQYGVESMGGGVFYRKSLDDGITWGQPVDISQSCVPDERVVIAMGPTHGIETSKGVWILPIWMVPKGGDVETAHAPSVVSTLYSTDKGKTWKVGEKIWHGVTNPSETVIAELSDGSIMLNMRNDSGRFCRAVVTSPTGYSNWSDVRFDETLIEPICNGSMVSYSRETLLFVNPANVQQRSNGTIRASFDDGKTWPIAKEFLQGDAGYSDVAVAPDESIHIFMEMEPLFSIGHFVFTFDKNNGLVEQ